MMHQSRPSSSSQSNFLCPSASFTPFCPAKPKLILKRSCFLAPLSLLQSLDGVVPMERSSWLWLRESRAKGCRHTVAIGNLSACSVVPSSAPIPSILTVEAEVSRSSTIACNRKSLSSQHCKNTINLHALDLDVGRGNGRRMRFIFFDFDGDERES